MTKEDQKALCLKHNVTVGLNFHGLNSDAVSRILAAAKEWKYRASRNAPGSTARMFYYYLCRVARRKE